MTSPKACKISRLLRCVLLGTAGFIISGILANVIIAFLDDYLLAAAVAGGAGGLYLSLLLQMHRKMIRSTIAGLIGMIAGLVVSMLLVEGFGTLFSSVGSFLEDTPIPDISAVVLMGVIFGGIFGAINYGRKSIWLFCIVCRIIAIPFGFLVVAMNAGYGPSISPENEFLKGIDLNFLAITIAAGIGVGLSIGIYVLRNTARIEVPTKD